MFLRKLTHITIFLLSFVFIFPAQADAEWGLGIESGAYIPLTGELSNFPRFQTFDSWISNDGTYGAFLVDESGICVLKTWEINGDPKSFAVLDQITLAGNPSSNLVCYSAKIVKSQNGLQPSGVIPVVISEYYKTDAFHQTKVHFVKTNNMLFGGTTVGVSNLYLSTGGARNGYVEQILVSQPETNERQESPSDFSVAILRRENDQKKAYANDYRLEYFTIDNHSDPEPYEPWANRTFTRQSTLTLTRNISDIGIASDINLRNIVIYGLNKANSNQRTNFTMRVGRVYNNKLLWGSVKNISSLERINSLPKFSISEDGSKFAASWLVSGSNNFIVKSRAGNIQGSNVNFGPISNITNSVTKISNLDFSLSGNGNVALFSYEMSDDELNLKVGQISSSNTFEIGEEQFLNNVLTPGGIPKTLINFDGDKAFSFWANYADSGNSPIYSSLGKIDGTNSVWTNPQDSTDISEEIRVNGDDIKLAERSPYTPIFQFNNSFTNGLVNTLRGGPFTIFIVDLDFDSPTFNLLNLTPPVIEGEAGIEQDWTLDAGLWQGESQLNIDWWRCDDFDDTILAPEETLTAPTGCQQISTNNESIYKTTPNDGGKYLRASVTAYNLDFDYSLTAWTQTSEEILLPPAPGTNPPTIETDFKVGESLLVNSNGTWENDTDIEFKYEWFLCDTTDTSVRLNPKTPPSGCKSILNETKNEIAIKSSFENKFLRAKVTAINPSGRYAIYTKTTPRIYQIPTPPVNVQITGNSAVGKTLTAPITNWKGRDNKYAYRWFRCESLQIKSTTTLPAGCTLITGATSSNLTLTTLHRATPPDKNYLISEIKGTNPGGITTIFTASSKAVIRPPVQGTTGTLPRVINSTPASETIDGVEYLKFQAENSTWTGDFLTYSYRWYLCTNFSTSTSSATSIPTNCKLVVGETSSNINVQKSTNLNKYLRVVVGASNEVSTIQGVLSRTGPQIK